MPDQIDYGFEEEAADIIAATGHREITEAIKLVGLRAHGLSGLGEPPEAKARRVFSFQPISKEHYRHAFQNEDDGGLFFEALAMGVTPTGGPEYGLQIWTMSEGEREYLSDPMPTLPEAIAKMVGRSFEDVVLSALSHCFTPDL